MQSTGIFTDSFDAQSRIIQLCNSQEKPESRQFRNQLIQMFPDYPLTQSLKFLIDESCAEIKRSVTIMQEKLEKYVFTQIMSYAKKFTVLEQITQIINNENEELSDVDGLLQSLSNPSMMQRIQEQLFSYSNAQKQIELYFIRYLDYFQQDPPPIEQISFERVPDWAIVQNTQKDVIKIVYLDIFILYISYYMINNLCNWNHLVDREIQKTKQYILSVTCSHDGQFIASAGEDSLIHIYDTQSGNEAHRLSGHTDIVKSIYYSKDNRFIVSGGADNTVRLWNTETLQQIKDPFVNHNNTISCVCFSPDGMKVAYSSYDEQVRIRNIQTSEEQILTGHKNAVLSLIYSPNGRILITGGADDTIRLWNTNTGKQFRCIQSEFASTVYCVTLTSSGKTFASAYGNNIIRSWNIHKGKQINCFEGHKAIVSALSFSPDGKFLVSGSNDKQIWLWNMMDRKSTILEGHQQSVYQVMFSPDGRYIISGGDDNVLKIQRVIQI